ncbi:mannose-1-phosphate guanylyltransferase [Brachybacterium phenoliresistens]|uniref:mannose-1-phosphate guanylyltransferase n=1 Tax=Brachybacterium phenoliresistens TaxID=396014 RepID=UPI000A02D523|nr:mannose-1-phosphate guanylyltransferase [Brachybacterium phenoliresistens]
MPRSQPSPATPDVSGQTFDAAADAAGVRKSPFVPVIPAGGAGTRLWPLSRRSRPKFLLDLTGSGRSLLQQTLDRVLPLADRPPLIVTGTAHAAEVAEQAAGRARVLAEPSPRNSMPAIALAAAVAEREDPGAVIGSFAADHLVGDDEAFAAAVDRARAAAEKGYLVTLGITPTSPATGFGYIEQSAAGGPPGGAGEHGGERAPADLAGTGARPVAQFVEKPDRERAEAFLATGRFFWNAGMFVVKAAVLLDALAVQIPALAAGAREIAAQGASADALARIWPSLTAIAIDHALAEPLAAQGRVAVVPADFAWDDVGDFAALARQLRAARADGPAAAQAEDDVVALGGARVLAAGSHATVHGASDRLIALVGVQGISVVETEDVLLVIADERAQDLGALVRGLDEAGLGDLG